MIQKAWVTHMCDTYKLSARKATGDTVGGIILAMMTMIMMRTAATMTIEAMPQQSCSGMMSESSILLMSFIRCVFLDPAPYRSGIPQSRDLAGKTSW